MLWCGSFQGVDLLSDFNPSRLRARLLVFCQQGNRFSNARRVGI